MQRALVSECHVAKGLDCSMALLDIKAFFDSMDLVLLFAASVRRVYPVRILLLAFQLFLSPRSLKVDGWVASAIFPTKSITAGETSGVEMARTLLYDLLHWLHCDYPLVTAAQWIDDLVLYIAGTYLHVQRILPQAVLGLSSRLCALGLEVASKSRIVSSRRDLSMAMRVLLGKHGLQVQDASVASDLGIDQRCGRRGARPKARARSFAARNRTSQIHKLGAHQGLGHTLFVTGPCAAEA